MLTSNRCYQSNPCQHKKVVVCTSSHIFRRMMDSLCFSKLWNDQSSRGVMPLAEEDRFSFHLPKRKGHPLHGETVAIELFFKEKHA